MNIDDPIQLYEKHRSKLNEDHNKDEIYLIVIGHVDAGKSTLMGRLLYELGQVNQKLMHKYEQESKKLGKQSFMYAWILDETGEERSRGITMDIGRSYFETETKRVILLDAPGHKDFIPNMISGAGQADCALLVVDATRGEFETGFDQGGQTREHALLVRSLGVSQISVVINKMDMVDWSEERFNEIKLKLGQFLKQIGFREKDVSFVPCSGLSGENLTEVSNNQLLTNWYSGPTLIKIIDKFLSPERPITKPFRMFVNDIYKGTGSSICVDGRIETGYVQNGQRVLVLPAKEISQIRQITSDNKSDACQQQTYAFAGEQVCLNLINFDLQKIQVGSIISSVQNCCPITQKFELRVLVFNLTVPITKGFMVLIHHQSLVEPAYITKLIAQINKTNGEVIKKHPKCIVNNQSALIEITTNRPICLELYSNIKELGRVMLRVSGVTIGAGLVTKIHEIDK